MPNDTELTQTEIERMTNMIAPTWEITETAPVTAGLHSVHRIRVSTSLGEQECYLKATPAGKHPTVDLEARLLSVLTQYTEIPVPNVYGVVDEHSELPTPFVLLEAIPGKMTPRTELSSISNTTLQKVAYKTGQHLAELHSLDAVDSYGFLSWNGPSLSGSQPSGELETIAVSDPISDWKERLQNQRRQTIQNLDRSRFADIVSDVEPVLKSEIRAVNGQFEPVLARIDNSVENLLFEQGEMSAMLDWEFTIASTPADDLVNVIWSLAGGPYLFAPETPDHRDLIEESVLSGYEVRGDISVIEQFRMNKECYELFTALRSMVHLENWFHTFDLGGEIDSAAAELRGDVNTRL